MHVSKRLLYVSAVVCRTLIELSCGFSCSWSANFTRFTTTDSSDCDQMVAETDSAALTVYIEFEPSYIFPWAINESLERNFDDSMSDE